VGVFGNDPINAEETGVGGVRELLRHPLRDNQKYKTKEEGDHGGDIRTGLLSWTDNFDAS
jgi:hypothetical protein